MQTAQRAPLRFLLQPPYLFPEPVVIPGAFDEGEGETPKFFKFPQPLFVFLPGHGVGIIVIQGQVADLAQPLQHHAGTGGAAGLQQDPGPSSRFLFLPEDLLA